MGKKRRLSSVKHENTREHVSSYEKIKQEKVIEKKEKGEEGEEDKQKEKEDVSVEPTKKTLKTWCLPKVKEWTLPPEQVAGFVKEVAVLVGKKNPRVLVLGAGYSSVAQCIYQAGFKQLVVTDIDTASVEFQRSLFEVPPQIECDDILNSKLPPNSFDIILDASVADVFIRQKMRGAKVMVAFESLLAPKGAILSLSIFHKPWKRLTSAHWISSYAVVEHFIRSARRPSAGGIPHPIGVLVHQRKSEWRSFKSSLSTRLLSEMRLNEMASGSEDM